MSLKQKIVDIRHTLAFRLTLWYAGIFMLSACVAFLFFYLLIVTISQIFRIAIPDLQEVLISVIGSPNFGESNLFSKRFDRKRSLSHWVDHSGAHSSILHIILEYLIGSCK